MNVASNCTNFVLNGSEVEVHFIGSYSHICVENLGSSTIKISLNPDIENQTSGVIQRPPKSSVVINVPNSTIYISGDSGTVNVIATNSAENPFKIASEGGGGSGSGGVTNYNDLSNKPSIDGIVLSGDMTSEELGLGGGKLTLIHHQDVVVQRINQATPSANIIIPSYNTEYLLFMKGALAELTDNDYRTKIALYYICTGGPPEKYKMGSRPDIIQKLNTENDSDGTVLSAGISRDRSMNMTLEFHAYDSSYDSCTYAEAFLYDISGWKEYLFKE